MAGDQGNTAKPHPGAIAVEGIDVLDNSLEVARLWIEDGGPATCLINPEILGEPEMFGLLMVDTIRHAARAYAQCYGMPEDEALGRILEGVQMETASPTTDIETTQDYGKSN